MPEALLVLLVWALTAQELLEKLLWGFVTLRLLRGFVSPRQLFGGAVWGGCRGCFGGISAVLGPGRAGRGFPLLLCPP